MEAAIEGEHHQDHQDTEDDVSSKLHLAYSRSPSPARQDSRDDFHSPRISRSISRSPSHQYGGNYRSNQRSPSPTENGRSPHDERDFASDILRSPRGDSHGRSRSLSLGSR